VVPSEPPSDEEYTTAAPADDPLSSPAHDEPLSDDEDASFSSTTTVEGCSSDGSRTLIASDSGPHQSIFVAGNGHTKSVLAPRSRVTKVKSPSGTIEQSSVSKFKLFNRSLPRLVSRSKQPLLHSFCVRVSWVQSKNQSDGLLSRRMKTQPLARSILLAPSCLHYRVYGSSLPLQGNQAFRRR